MASEVDICNVALGHLGDSGTVASLEPPEGSAQAEHCARFYPIARDTLLSMHPWNFSTRRAALARLSGSVPGWSYTYALPTDVLDLFAVLGPGDVEAGSGPMVSVAHPYVRESTNAGAQVVYCNIEHATARYAARIEDTTRFSPLFTTALTWHLASMLAGPMLKGDAGMAEAKRCMQMVQVFIGQAKGADANQRHTERNHTPDWIAARGGMVPGFYRGR